MQKDQENSLLPTHPSPVGRLKLEVVDLKTTGLEGSLGGSACVVCATSGCLADDE